MRRITKCLGLAAAVLGLLITVAGQTRAEIIVNIFDNENTGTVFATFNGQTVLPTPGTEYLNFNVDTGFIPSNSDANTRDILEPDGTTLSDRAFESSTAGSSLLNIQFGSDSSISFVPPAPPSLLPLVVENGTLQRILSYSETSPILVPLVVIFASSGVAPVPEPSTLVMGGTAALIGLGYWWRRRRGAAALRKGAAI